MSNVDKFYRDGSLTLNVNYEAKPGSPLICLDKGKWYKFQIDRVEKLDDCTFNITSTTLISIDDRIVTD